MLDVLYLVLAGWFTLGLPGNISRQDMILFLRNAVAALLVRLLWWSSRRRRYCYVVVDGDRVLYGPGRDAPTELRLHGVRRAEYSALAREVCLARCVRAHHRNGALPLGQWSHRAPDV